MTGGKLAGVGALFFLVGLALVIVAFQLLGILETTTSSGNSVVIALVDVGSAICIVGGAVCLIIGCLSIVGGLIEAGDKGIKNLQQKRRSMQPKEDRPYHYQKQCRHRRD